MTLTPREKEILQAYIDQDFKVTEGAKAAHESYSTFKRYLGSIMKKLNKPTYAAAAFRAKEEGII